MNEIAMSIIIPTHGRVELFKETLDSLSKQTSRDFEVIVTDDSSEETERLAIKDIVNNWQKKNKDISIKYIFTKPNLLQAKNTNQGLKEAKGKYMRILHSDDLLAPECIEYEINAFNEFPDCYFLNHSAKAFNSDIHFNTDCTFSTFSIYNCWLKSQIFTGCILPTSMAFRREVYLSIGGMNEQYKFLCDWDFFFRIILNEYLNGRDNAIYISGALVGWRNHENSITETMALTHFTEHENFIKHIVPIYKKYKLISKKELSEVQKLAEQYRYRRILSDYEKYKNFVLPTIPLIYTKDYETVNFYFNKLKKHIKLLLRPFLYFINWIIQPISIIFYLLKYLYQFIRVLLKYNNIIK